MEKYKTIQEDIEKASEHKVVKQNSFSLLAIMIMIVAVGLAIAGAGSEDPNASWPSFLFVASAFLFLGGLVKLCVHRSCYLFKPTNSKLKERVLFFATHESEVIQDCIEGKVFERLEHVKREKDSGVRVQAMVTDDQNFVAVQISEYIPYTYEATSPVVCYYGEEAKNFIRYFK